MHRARALGLMLVLGARTEAQLDEARVRAAYAEALVAVAEEFGTALEPAPPLVFVPPHELGRRAAEDGWLPFDPEDADATLGRSLMRPLLEQQYATKYIAVYSRASQEILVALSTWHTLSRQLAREDLLAEEAARVVLVHELVHALDDQRYGLESIVACLDEERAAGFSAVVEGHAQHQTRRLAAARGWKAGFEALLAVVEAPDPALMPPELLEPFVETTGLATACNAGNPGPEPHPYKDGERFMAALSARNDPALITSVLRHPPEAEAIFHPEWFLDPATRPFARFEAEPALVVAQRPEPPWFTLRLTLTRAQLRAAAAPLPPERLEPLLASLQSAHMVELSTFHPSRRVALAVLEFTDEVAAQAYAEAVHERDLLLDEQPSLGLVCVLGTESVELEGSRGFWSAKHLEDRGETIDVTSIVLSSGPLVLETTFRNEPITPAAHLALVRRALQSVKPR